MSQFTTFRYNSRGGLVMDRDSLHESEGYRRQVDALKQLRNTRTPMADTDFLKGLYIPTTELRFLVLGKNPLVTVLQQKFRSPQSEIDEWRNVPIVEEPGNG